MTDPKGTKDSLGRRILQARLQLAANNGQPVTQQSIADELGVTGVTVSRWEADKKEPDLRTIRALAEVLGVTPGWLAFGGSRDDDAGQRRELKRDAIAELLTKQQSAVETIRDAYWRSVNTKTVEGARALAAQLIDASIGLLRAIFAAEDGDFTQASVNNLDAILTARISEITTLEDAQAYLDELIDFAHDTVGTATANPVPGSSLSLRDLERWLLEMTREDYLPPDPDHVAMDGKVLPIWRVEVKLAQLRDRKDLSLYALSKRAVDLGVQHYFSSSWDLIDNADRNFRLNREVYDWREQLERELDSITDPAAIIDHVLDAARVAEAEVHERNRTSDPESSQLIQDVRRLEKARRARRRRRLADVIGPLEKPARLARPVDVEKENVPSARRAKKEPKRQRRTE